MTTPFDLTESLYRLTERVGIVFGDRKLTESDKEKLKQYREYQDWKKAKEQKR